MPHSVKSCDLILTEYGLHWWPFFMNSSVKNLVFELHSLLSFHSIAVIEEALVPSAGTVAFKKAPQASYQSYDDSYFSANISKSLQTFFSLSSLIAFLMKLARAAEVTSSPDYSLVTLRPQSVNFSNSWLPSKTLVAIVSSHDSSITVS